MKFRSDKLQQLNQHKISLYDFSDFTFNYFYQHKIKHEAKAHDENAIIFNYFYWITQIERRSAKERKLIALNLGSHERFYQNIEMFQKRRDQMVRRLIEKLNLEVEEIYLIFGNTLEITFKDIPYVFHCQKSSLDRLDLNISQIKKSKIGIYLPLINIKLEIPSI